MSARVLEEISMSDGAREFVSFLVWLGFYCTLSVGLIVWAYLAAT